VWSYGRPKPSYIQMFVSQVCGHESSADPIPADAIATDAIPLVENCRFLSDNTLFQPLPRAWADAPMDKPTKIVKTAKHRFIDPPHGRTIVSVIRRLSVIPRTCPKAKAPDTLWESRSASLKNPLQCCSIPIYVPYPASTKSDS
jgi:hypothetical protein